MHVSRTPLSSCFTRRFMGRSQLGGTFDPVFTPLHQHLLHTVQPLPSSSSVYPLSHVLQIAERFHQTPRLASLPEKLRNSSGSFAPRELPQFNATANPSATFSPSFLFPVQPVIGRTCSRV